MMENKGKAKYFILMERLKEDILQGKRKPGDKLPSENELAKEYDISRHTVRKALAILSNEGYIEIEHGRGSFCADIHKNNKSSKNIAVITTYISDYIFPRLIQGMDKILTEKGYSIILKNTKNSRKLELAALEDVLTKHVDGIIIEPSKSQIYSKHMEVYQKLEEQNIPYVFIHGVHAVMRDKPNIVMDDEKGAYLLTQYLIQLGHKKLIGIFKTDDNQGINRHNGFAKAIGESKMVYQAEDVIWYHTEDRAIKPQEEIRRMILDGKKFDAIVCYNDQIAYSIMKVLKEYQVEVPRDVSVTGFDNSIGYENGMAAITTIGHPQEKLGAMAAELLLEKIEGIPEEQSKVARIIEPELILKDSCMRRDT